MGAPAVRPQLAIDPSWAKLVRKSATRAIVSMAWCRSSGRGSAAVMVCGPTWISMVR